MSRTNKTRFIEWHGTCKCECKFGENVSNINNVGTKINVDVNAKKLIDKMVCSKYLFGILVILSVNVIKHVILVNI